MTEVVPLADALEEARFGAKATGLGAAARAGLPIPPGIALSGAVVEDVAAGNTGAVEQVLAASRALTTPLAVRSSAVDEDGAEASFAGQHLTLLNVPSADDVGAAVREIWWSANSDSAITYRQRVGLFTRPSVGVVVQVLLDQRLLVLGRLVAEFLLQSPHEPKRVFAARGFGGGHIRQRLVLHHSTLAISACV